MEEQEKAERKTAEAKRSAAATVSTDTSTGNKETLKCTACEQDLDASHFNKNQWSKGVGKARCRICVEKALQDEKRQQEESQAAKLQAAKDNVVQAHASGNAQAILKAESELAALEAEKVTGLKPVKMGRGGGAGRGRGRAGRDTTGVRRSAGRGRR